MHFTKKTAASILNAALATGADYAEIYYQEELTHRYSRRFKKVNNVRSDFSCGVGIRILKDKQAAYACTSNLNKGNLMRLAEELALAFDGERKITFCADDFKKKKFTVVNKIKIPHSAWTDEEKLAYLKKGEDKAFSLSDKVTNVTCGIFEQDEHVEIYNSDGAYNKDDRVRTRLTFLATVSDGEKFQEGFFGPGLSQGLELLENNDIEKIAENCVNDALNLLTAIDSPSGEMPVILGNQFGGVLFHEACGHPLEGTAIFHKTSPFSGKIGEKIASDCVTAIDDGTIKNGWGSESMDDEAIPPTRNYLIKDGILTNYMVDRLTSRAIAGSHPTGSCRRESYRYMPVTRMTNTYIDNGKSTVEEIFAAVKDGIYCKDFTGGQVDTSTDQFVFTSNNAYLVKDGKIGHIIKPISLIGYGYEILKRIVMVANDLGRSPGVCGAASGSCYVEVGQPTLLIEKMLVGGTGGDK